MKDTVFQAAQALKDSINKIETVVDKMIINGAGTQSFEYLDIILRFGINLLAIFILVRLIYYSTHKNKDYLFTFFLFKSLRLVGGGGGISAPPFSVLGWFLMFYQGIRY